MNRDTDPWDDPDSVQRCLERFIRAVEFIADKSAPDADGESLGEWPVVIKHKTPDGAYEILTETKSIDAQRVHRMAQNLLKLYEHGGVARLQSFLIRAAKAFEQRKLPKLHLYEQKIFGIEKSRLTQDYVENEFFSPNMHLGLCYVSGIVTLLGAFMLAGAQAERMFRSIREKDIPAYLEMDKTATARHDQLMKDSAEAEQMLDLIGGNAAGIGVQALFWLLMAKVINDKRQLRGFLHGLDCMIENACAASGQTRDDLPPSRTF